MRKRANLLFAKKDYFKKEKYFYYFRGVTVGFGVISIIVLIIMIYLMMSISLETEVINRQISDVQKYLNKNQQLRTDINYFNQKNNLAGEILKKDVNFVPYYNKLIQYIPVSTDQATINSINFNNKHEVDFILTFTEYENFINFLSALQTKSFLDIFDKLSLESFSIREGKMNNYQLELKGILKALEAK